MTLTEIAQKAKTKERFIYGDISSSYYFFDKENILMERSEEGHVIEAYLERYDLTRDDWHFV